MFFLANLGCHFFYHVLLSTPLPRKFGWMAAWLRVIVDFVDVVLRVSIKTNTSRTICLIFVIICCFQCFPWVASVLLTSLTENRQKTRRLIFRMDS